MILPWLGAFALMLFGLERAHKTLQTLLGFKVKNPLLRIILQISPERSLYKGALGLGYGEVTPRKALIALSFSFLGSWLVFLLSGLVAEIQGVIFLGIGSFIFLNIAWFKKLYRLFQFIFSMGLFLVGAEFLLRQSALLQSVLGENDIAFWLVDGRAPAVLSLVVVGFILGLVLRLQFWSLMLGLALLISSTISFSGALALFAGERLAQILILYWISRSFPQGRILLRRWSICSALGAITGFFITWYLKEAFGWGSSFGFNGSEERFSQFLILSAVLLLIQGLFQMVAGHFLARSVPENAGSQDPQTPIPIGWFESEVLTRDEDF